VTKGSGKGRFSRRGGRSEKGKQSRDPVSRAHRREKRGDRKEGGIHIKIRGERAENGGGGGNWSNGWPKEGIGVNKRLPKMLGAVEVVQRGEQISQIIYMSLKRRRQEG